jgi:hypothetical protein
MLRAVRSLSTDLTQVDKRPYFLWDEDVTVAELRSALRGDDRELRLRLLGKMLREARDSDVWLFVTPEEVEKELPLLTRRMGRRAPFWNWLIGGWRRDGLLAG